MLDSFCRSCMFQIIGSNDKIIKSFHIFQTKDLAQKFTQCTNLQVHPDDNYPSSVCDKCFASILRLHDFQVMCVASIEKFAKMIGNKSQPESSFHMAKDNVKRLASVPNHEEQKCDNFQQPDMEDPLSAVSTNSLAESHSEKSTTSSNCSKNKTKRCRKLKESPEEKLTKLHTLNNRKEIVNEATNKNTSHKPISATKNVQEENYCIGSNFQNSSGDDESITDSDSAAPKSKSPLHRLPFQCDICSKKFRFQHRLEAHNRMHQGQPGYPCTRENCERTFNRRSYLQQHLKHDHDGIPRTIFKCEFANCQQTYTCKSGLRAHKRKYHSDKPITPKIHMCETCGAVVTSSRSLRDHRFIHIDKSEWPFVCDIEGCLKKFRILHQLKIHQKRHAGIKNYACPHCEMRFVTSTNLKNHINHHTWEKTWSCEFCPKICNTPATLRAHIKNKHGHRAGEDPVAKPTRRYQCCFCDRAFVTADGKKYHERVHTGEKPHICYECGKKFRQPTALRTHKRTHIKDAPRDYVCRICGSAYFTPQTLKHHEMKHTGEKPYKCDECNLKFRWQSNLARHRSLHQRDNQTKETQDSSKQSKIEES